MEKILDFNVYTKKIKYKGYSIQTYSFGEGNKVIISLPPYPSPGIIYLWFFKQYDPKKYKVITFDVPGWIGNSENIFEKTAFSFDELLSITKSILQSYNVDKFNILGYSFGTSLGILLAADMKDKIDKLVLVSPMVNGSLLKPRTLNLIKTAKIFNLGFVIRYHVNGILNNIMDVINNIKDPELKSNINKYTVFLKGLNNQTLLDSVYHLFTDDRTNILKIIQKSNIKLMILSSIDEPTMFKKQAQYLRKIFSDEKSIYLHGQHEDFVMFPKSEVVDKVVKFLIS